VLSKSKTGWNLKAANMDKAIRRITDLDQQQMETHCYWQSRPVGERLVPSAN